MLFCVELSFYAPLSWALGRLYSVNVTVHGYLHIYLFYFIGILIKYILNKGLIKLVLKYIGFIKQILLISMFGLWIYIFYKYTLV